MTTTLRVLLVALLISGGILAWQNAQLRAVMNDQTRLIDQCGEHFRTTHLSRD